MSWKLQAVAGNMILATYENAKLLGIEDEWIRKTLGRDNDPRKTFKIWEDEIRDYSISGDGTKMLNIEGRNVFSEIRYISPENKEFEAGVYFCFSFDDLYTFTPVGKALQKVGMEIYYWVEGGYRTSLNWAEKG